jgi:hypothetical protein
MIVPSADRRGMQKVQTPKSYLMAQSDEVKPSTSKAAMSTWLSRLVRKHTGLVTAKAHAASGVKHSHYQQDTRAIEQS